MVARDDRDRAEVHSAIVQRDVRSNVGFTTGFNPTASRSRRGLINVVPTKWRACAMGTNHIACYGVWRVATRRQKHRLNRTGTTRWHKPHVVADA